MTFVLYITLILIFVPKLYLFFIRIHILHKMHNLYSLYISLIQSVAFVSFLSVVLYIPYVQIYILCALFIFCVDVYIFVDNISI